MDHTSRYLAYLTLRSEVERLTDLILQADEGEVPLHVVLDRVGLVMSQAQLFYSELRETIGPVARDAGDIGVALDGRPLTLEDGMALADLAMQLVQDLFQGLDLLATLAAVEEIGLRGS